MSHTQGQMGLKHKIKAKLLNYWAFIQMTRRRTYIIHPGAQFRIAIFAIGIAGLALTCTVLAVEWTFDRVQFALLESGYPIDHPILQLLVQQKQFMGWVYLGVAVLSVAAGWVFGILLSHRMVGPLIRIHRQLIEAAQGKRPEQIKFRQNDFFHELAEAYNEEVKELSELEERRKLKSDWN